MSTGLAEQSFSEKLLVTVGATVQQTRRRWLPLVFALLYHRSLILTYGILECSKTIPPSCFSPSQNGWKGLLSPTPSLQSSPTLAARRVSPITCSRNLKSSFFPTFQFLFSLCGYSPWGPRLPGPRRCRLYSRPHLVRPPLESGHRQDTIHTKKLEAFLEPAQHIA